MKLYSIKVSKKKEGFISVSKNIEKINIYWKYVYTDIMCSGIEAKTKFV